MTRPGGRMSTNDEIFLDFWRNYEWLQPMPMHFRLYHDESGRPLCYSRSDQPGCFIEVTPEVFAVADMQVKIRDGKLVRPPPRRLTKLVPDRDGIACHSEDITITVEPTYIPCKKWKMRSHDTD